MNQHFLCTFINAKKIQRTISLLLFWGLLINHSFAQTTAIPDPAFEQKLITLGIDSDGLVNGQILNSDAAAVTGSLLIDTSNIQDLTGIEAFVNLNDLRCSNNLLTSLDLTNNPNLGTVIADFNQLDEVDLSNCPNLSAIGLEGNNLLQLSIVGCHPFGVGYLNTRNNRQGLRICVPDVNFGAIPGYIDDASTIYTDDECYSRAVEGRVVIDDNNDCLVDPSEKGLLSQVIRFEKWGDAVYFSTHDTLGNYHAYLDTGTYNVSIATNYNPYWQSCPVSSQTLTVTSTSGIQIMDWTLRSTTTCPYLYVDISAPFLRETGSGSYYTVNYCNLGTAPSNNAYVEVDIDPLLTVLSTSLPVASQSGNQYTFNLGNLGVAQCGDFTIQVIADTATNFMQTLCSEAHIFPDSLCVASLWSGAQIEVHALCQNDTIIFDIHNIGAAMGSPEPYFVFEDNIMMMQNSFQLGAGASTQVSIPAGLGRTYRLNATQQSGYPILLGDPVATGVSEGCNPFPGGLFNTGFVNQFSNGYSSPFMAIDCQPIIGSYDPNDKSAQPAGYDSTHHYIDQYTSLDYKVRFQNTGTDTAFNIYIMDTISALLDLSSLQMGVSSHDYTWSIEQGNVLKVRFDNILLVDSNANEPLSHGFFRYRIQQQANNPIGSIIYNTADIYFDYNPPIRTNTYWHTVGENFILVTVDKVYNEMVDVKIYPNPFQHSTTIEVQGYEFETLQLSIYDVAGRLARIEETSFDNKIQLSKGNLQPGIYFYHLVGNDTQIHSGKIVVQ